jgi:protein subunit release factor B
MGNISASKDKQEALRKRMENLGIFEKDIVEKFIRSSGKGGQKVNKASTCVYLKHLPTKIEVKCQEERYQALNRYLARRILTDKIEEMIKGCKDSTSEKKTLKKSQA